MDREFSYILEQHLARYPDMTPQDLGKLAFQSEFGPEHLVSVTPDLVVYLQTEWQSVAPGSLPRGIEPIGNGLCRFHLDPGWVPAEAAPLLAELFAKAAREHTGTVEGLQQRLEQISKLNLPGWTQWLEQYAAQSYPPQRHSQQFRDAYQPHYRVIFEKDAQHLLHLLHSR